MVSQWKGDRLSTKKNKKKLMAISECLGCDLHVGFWSTKSVLNVNESRFALLFGTSKSVIFCI